MMEIFYAEIIGEIAPMINSIIFTLIAGLATWLGIQAESLMSNMKENEKIKEIKKILDTKKELVEISVDYVEQIGEHLLSEEKKALAIKQASEMAKGWGIEISEVELETLVEQAVLGFQDGYNKVDVEFEDDETIEARAQLAELKEMTKGGKN